MMAIRLRLRGAAAAVVARKVHLPFVGTRAKVAVAVVLEAAAAVQFVKLQARLCVCEARGRTTPCEDGHLLWPTAAMMGRSSLSSMRYTDMALGASRTVGHASGVSLLF
jgi:hypothetical protein